MDQLYFWDISWSDENFETSIVKVQSRIDKLNRSFFAIYSKHKESLEEVDGIVQDLISYQATRSQAVGEFRC